MQRFGHLFFWIAHIIYLIDFRVLKMVILVFLLGVIRGGVCKFKPTNTGFFLVVRSFSYSYRKAGFWSLVPNSRDNLWRQTPSLDKL